MQLTQRGKKGVWYYRFTAPNGKRIFCSARTTDKRLAQELADKAKHQAWRESALGEKPRRSWQAAAVRYGKEKQHRRTIENIKLYLRTLDPWLHNLMLDEIDRDLVDEIISAKLNDGLSNASVNRILEVLRAVLRAAYEKWEWLDRVPHIEKLPEPKRRIIWLPKDVAEKLLTELPDHVSAMAEFSLATGFRESNVTGLEWSQLDLERKVAWIHPDQAKTNKPLGIPLNDEAVAVIKAQEGKHPTRVFTYAGKPVAKAGSVAWRKTLDRCKIRKYVNKDKSIKNSPYPHFDDEEYLFKDFRWHDLRHTWASWHVQSGTPLAVLQQLGGWASFDMVLKYAHLAPEHLADYASNTCINSAKK